MMGSTQAGRRLQRKRKDEAGRNGKGKRRKIGENKRNGGCLNALVLDVLMKES